MREKEVKVLSTITKQEMIDFFHRFFNLFLCLVILINYSIL